MDHQAPGFNDIYAKHPLMYHQYLVDLKADERLSFVLFQVLFNQFTLERQLNLIRPQPFQGLVTQWYDYALVKDRWKLPKAAPVIYNKAPSV
jgi:hypothetical protein